MKVELLVSEWCASCHDAERIWREVAQKKQIDFAVVDMGQPEGRQLATRLRIRSIPAVVVDGELKHIGLLDRTAATALVADAPERTQWMS
jgi:glutaredoxin